MDICVQYRPLFLETGICWPGLDWIFEENVFSTLINNFSIPSRISWTPGNLRPAVLWGSSS